LLHTVHAQYGTPASLKAELQLRPSDDLIFPNTPSAKVDLATLGNSLHTPSTIQPATKKYPALIIFHTCGGISEHIQFWVQEALKENYVVLVPDAMRGLKDDCGSPPKIPNARFLKDVLDGAIHLAKLPYVDAQRIGVIGFSKGAFMATWLSSPSVAQAIRPDAPRLAALVGLYGFCGLPPTKGRPEGAILLQPDTDRPLLMLMGKEDTETVPDSCLELMPKLKQAQAPVQWHVYPNAMHCWDCKEKDGFTKYSPASQQRVTYRFDQAITQDSRDRVFDFLRGALR
jgi:dienelactone hydrolase